MKFRNQRTGLLFFLIRTIEPVQNSVTSYSSPLFPHQQALDYGQFSPFPISAACLHNATAQKKAGERRG